ncbi:hypothetical protein BKA91DRAFT_137001 [Yarrowia lipolytica]|uniref:Uncharacterized protein n=1 Tax=Yarrowia lipolytica TaxID=4952 RepID=A0A371CAE4_YARLL|nr:hypothetical protein BKA91DRAFT_137001 [Yarrowia lipolytica]KAE8172443.1 hypothetical protein BKA90DRAFT_137231 [Yarrowia lipolytica]RDW27281.1 hypothetical protein B0I71DRAFT_129483 [Yarrowia lipolytica]RMI94337.1 hypothetical protein BD777DRAFT_131664 [Yarrowia lipolytica]
MLRIFLFSLSPFHLSSWSSRARLELQHVTALNFITCSHGLASLPSLVLRRSPTSALLRLLLVPPKLLEGLTDIQSGISVATAVSNPEWTWAIWSRR